VWRLLLISLFHSICCISETPRVESVQAVVNIPGEKGAGVVTELYATRVKE